MQIQKEKEAEEATSRLFEEGEQLPPIPSAAEALSIIQETAAPAFFYRCSECGFTYVTIEVARLAACRDFLQRITAS